MEDFRSKTLWRKLLGFRVGDRIKIVDVFDKVLKKENWIGKTGTIISKEVCYYLEGENILYSTLHSKKRKAIQCYKVLLDNKSRREKIILVTSDMEILER